MKLIDILNRVDRSETNADTGLAYNDRLFEALGLTCSYESSEQLERRLKAYWLTRWYCTDTWVGTRVYFFDERPVAYSHQPARKSNERFYFVSQADAEALRSFLIQFQAQSPTDYEVIPNLDEDVLEASHRLQFSGQLMDYLGLYQGQPVEVDQKRLREMCRDEYLQKNVPLTDGRVIPISEFEIPFHLKPD